MLPTQPRASAGVSDSDKWLYLAQRWWYRVSSIHGTWVPPTMRRNRRCTLSLNREGLMISSSLPKQSNTVLWGKTLGNWVARPKLWFWRCWEVEALQHAVVHCTLSKMENSAASWRYSCGLASWFYFLYFLWSGYLQAKTLQVKCNVQLGSGNRVVQTVMGANFFKLFTSVCL